MRFKVPHNSEKYYWTRHSVYKMKHYGLSPQRIARVIRNPERIEEGIVPRTIAVMQRASQNKKSGEIWCMYQIKNPKFKIPNPKQISDSKIKNSKLILNSAKQQLRVISAWRYPGVSPKNNPIPEEILREIGKIL